MNSGLLSRLITRLAKNVYSADSYHELRAELSMINEPERKEKQHPTDRIQSGDRAAVRQRFTVYGENTTAEPADDLVGVICESEKDEEGNEIAWIDVPSYVDIELEHPDRLLKSNPNRDLERYTKFKFYPSSKAGPPKRLHLVRVKLPRNHLIRDYSNKESKALYFDILTTGPVVQLKGNTPGVKNPAGEGTRTTGLWNIQTEGYDPNKKLTFETKKFGKYRVSGGLGDKVAGTYTPSPKLQNMLSNICNFPQNKTFVQQMEYARQAYRDMVYNLDVNANTKPWKKCMVDAAAQYNIPLDLLKITAARENGVTWNGGTRHLDILMGVLEGTAKDIIKSTDVVREASSKGVNVSVASRKQPCAQIWLAANYFNTIYKSAKIGPSGRIPNRNDRDDMLYISSIFSTGIKGAEKNGFNKFDPKDPSTYGVLCTFRSNNTDAGWEYQHQRGLFIDGVLLEMLQMEKALEPVQAPPAQGNDGQGVGRPPKAPGNSSRTGSAGSLPTNKPKMVLFSVDTDISKASNVLYKVGVPRISVREDIVSDITKIKQLLNLYDIPFTCNNINISLNNKNISDLARVGLEINLNPYAGLTPDSNYDTDDYFIGPDPVNPSNRKLKLYGNVRKQASFGLQKFSPVKKIIDIYDIKETYGKNRPKIIKIFKSILDITEIFEYFGFYQAQADKEFYNISDNIKSNWYVFYKPSKIVPGYSYKELLSTVYDNNNENIWHEEEKYWDGSRFK